MFTHLGRSNLIVSRICLGTMHFNSHIASSSVQPLFPIDILLAVFLYPTTCAIIPAH